MAARSAGIPCEGALTIAEHAEVVDEAVEGVFETFDRMSFIDPDDNNHFHWRLEQWDNDKHVQRTASLVKSTKMMQKGQTRGPWHLLAWTAFHFFPNLDPANTGSEYQKQYEIAYELCEVYDKTKTRMDDNMLKEQQLICYPGSKLGNAMIEDLRRAITTRDADDLYRYIRGVLHPQDMNVVEKFKSKYGLDPIQFKDAYVGVRMHIYADFWAHQGFVGARSPRANDVAGLYVGNDFNHLTFFRKDGQAPKIERGKDLAIESHYGHGNAIRYPDLPGYVYKYFRPFDAKLIKRNNPEEFAKAYRALHEMFVEYQRVRGGQPYKAPAPFHPDRINVDFFKTMTQYDKVPRNNYYFEKIRAADILHMPNGFISRFLSTEPTDDYDLIAVMRKRLKTNPREMTLPYFALASLCHLCWVETKMDEHFGGSFHRWVGQHLMYNMEQKSVDDMTKEYEESGESFGMPTFEQWQKSSSAMGNRSAHGLTPIDDAVRHYWTVVGTQDEPVALVSICNLCRQWLSVQEHRTSPRMHGVLMLLRKAACRLRELVGDQVANFFTGKK